MNVKAPAKAGTYNVKCPGCSSVLQIKVDAPAQQPPSKPQVPSIGQFHVSSTSEATCPVCGQQISVHLSKRGQQMIQCSACGSQLAVEGLPPKTVLNPGGIGGIFNGNMCNGIIQVRKNIFARMLGSDQKWKLRSGGNTIGRADRTMPSDISLSDQAVSRRSIEIFVGSNPNDGITFKLTVLNASNPVYHNGNLMNVGDSLAMKFGDTIRLGTTTLELIPDHK